MMVSDVVRVMKVLDDYFSDRSRTTLNRMRGERDAFKILIACLLSLRTRDENTEKVCAKLFAVVDSPEEIVKIPVGKLEKLIFSSGHYKKKARVLKSVSRDLIDRFDSKVPRTREGLMSIKGIGPKTANIVLCFAFDEAVLPIDVHCHRIPNRLGWIETKTPEQTEVELGKILPKKYWRDFNGIFVLFGKTICQPISPWCSKCPVVKNCKRVGVGRSR